MLLSCVGLISTRTPGDRAASDVHLTNTFDLQQPLLHNSGRGIVKLSAAIEVRRKRDYHNRRVSRINFAISRVLRQVRGKISARSVDRRLDIAAAPSICDLNQIVA